MNVITEWKQSKRLISLPLGEASINLKSYGGGPVPLPYGIPPVPRSFVNVL